MFKKTWQKVLLGLFITALIIGGAVVGGIINTTDISNAAEGSTQQQAGYSTDPTVVVPTETVDPLHNCGDGSSSFEIEPGDTILVKAGCRVSGDVEVSTDKNGEFERLYDNDADTGLLVNLTADAQVTAPWGASADTETVDVWVANMKLSGCDGVCDTVNVVNWPTPDRATTEPVTEGAIKCVDGMSNVEIPAGETAKVLAGCRISGDVVVDDKVLYDNDGSTGLVIDLRTDAQVFAEWGASVNAESVDEWVDLMEATGCEGGKGCTAVEVVTWPR